MTTNSNGNVTGYNGMGFTYSNAGRLDTATSGASTVLTYAYDGFGQRLSKTDTARRYLVYGQRLALQP